MRRFQALRPADRIIVFYSEDAASWVHFAAIVRELTEVHGRRICYLTSDPNDPILNRHDSKVLPFCVGERGIRTFLFRALQAGVFVMTMPDLEAFHLKRSLHRVHYLYIFHSINSTHAVYLKSAFDHYDTIFCAGPHHMAEIRAMEKVYGLRGKTLVEHGYGRLDALIASAGQSAPRPLPNGGRRVLVAPSWGPDGLLETPVGAELVEALLKVGHHVTVRPHPMTRRTAPQALDGLCERFLANPCFQYEEDVASQESLHRSHLMVSDWSGAATEYAFALERPVLFVDTPRKIRNPEYEKVGLATIEDFIRTEIGVVIAPEDVRSAPEQIERLCADPERFRRKMRECRSRWVYNVGRSGAVGAQYILDLAERLEKRSA